MRTKQLKARSGPEPSGAGPGSTPRPDVKRLSSKPVVIAGAALLFVVLAVAFLVTSRPKPSDGAAAGPGGGTPEGPATAEFLNNEPTAAPPPGPACQGMECAASVAGGAAPGASAADSAALAAAAAQQSYGAYPPAGAEAAPEGADPYAARYGPAPEASAPAAAPAAPECDRRCRYRAARSARLLSDGAEATAAALASTGQQFRPGPDGLMPDAYYTALADSMMRAELSAYGSSIDAAGAAPHSGRNATAASQLAAAPAGDAGRAAPAPQAPATPSSPYVVRAGTLLPATLVTAINSDLCGDVKAVVTLDVFDARQRDVLVPAGTELLGTCSDQVAGGQARLAVAWTHLTFPDGRTLALPGLPTHSVDGRSGLRDRVNNHWGRVFGTAVLLSALGAGTQLGIPQSTDGGSLSPSQTAATAATAELSTLATEILRRNLDVKPTIEIRSMTKFLVLVHFDLDVGAPAPRPRFGGAR